MTTDINAAIKRARDTLQFAEEHPDTLDDDQINDAKALLALSNMRDWLDNNTTFCDVELGKRPVLQSVSKRIWYHATDDQRSFPFSALFAAGDESK